MSDYARDWSRVARYSTASHSDLPAMLAAIHPQSWQGKQWVDQTPRLVAADFMQELGRDKEAELLRDTTKHAYYHDGQIKSADDIAKEVTATSRRPGHGRAADLLPDERQHLETALWSSNDNSDDYGGEPLDANYTVHDIHPDTIGSMLADWRHFKTENAHLIGDDPDNRAAHDFWLTRNHHGAGFYDHNDYYNDNSHLLADAAHRYGEYHLDVEHDHDGESTIHGFGG